MGWIRVGLLTFFYFLSYLKFNHNHRNFFPFSPFFFPHTTGSRTRAGLHGYWTPPIAPAAALRSHECAQLCPARACARQPCRGLSSLPTSRYANLTYNGLPKNRLLMRCQYHNVFNQPCLNSPPPFHQKKKKKSRPK